MQVQVFIRESIPPGRAAIIEGHAKLLAALWLHGPSEHDEAWAVAGEASIHRVSAASLQKHIRAGRPIVLTDRLSGSGPVAVVMRIPGPRKGHPD